MREREICETFAVNFVNYFRRSESERFPRALVCVERANVKRKQ
jgi:hypothetical protein